MIDIQLMMGCACQLVLQLHLCEQCRLKPAPWRRIDRDRLQGALSSARDSTGRQGKLLATLYQIGPLRVLDMRRSTSCDILSGGCCSGSRVGGLEDPERMGFCSRTCLRNTVIDTGIGERCVLALLWRNDRTSTVNGCNSMRCRSWGLSCKRRGGFYE